MIKYKWVSLHNWAWRCYWNKILDAENLDEVNVVLNDGTLAVPVLEI